MTAWGTSVSALPASTSRPAGPPTPRACGYATTLRALRVGLRDPTTSITGNDHVGELWRATLTPDGPGTLHLRWTDSHLDARAWGDGADWLLDRVPALTGALDDPPALPGVHPAVRLAEHRHPWLRLGASGTLYHDVLPVIIAQRITGGEAIRQWVTLVHRLGAAAPGPNPALLLPPAPAAIAGRPAWWYHRLGIEAKRADALRTVAAHADHVHRWGLLDPLACRERLGLLRGIGQWTLGSVLGPVLGDPDAFAIGDFHLKNVVAWALAGRPRGTDDEMVELLEPYAGQRGRVVRLLLLDGHAAPKFGPRQRILPMARW